MYAKCPKCSQALPATGWEKAEECPACGLIFRKYARAQVQVPVRPATPRIAINPVASDSAGIDEIEIEDEALARIARRFLYVPAQVEAWRVYVNAGLFALTLFFGWRFYRMDIPEWEMSATFMHLIMVPFHEFGHLLFMPFGEFMTLAGGSLAQWLMPLGFLLHFGLKNKDNFTASLMLWWMGTQFLDLAPYAWDALVPQHILLSGRTGDNGAHDYIDMLGTLGLLNSAHGVARVMHATGLLVMMGAWAWGGHILWRQFQRRVDFVA